MNFNFSFPVKIFSGDGCIAANKCTLALGSHAFIVCGKNGARVCGALGDTQNALSELGIRFTVFDESIENPPLLMCFEGGKKCRKVGADFVIGIGGGSALDAAKAVAHFASNPEFEPNDIFDTTRSHISPLPLIAIPTTSGTGSEANGTSVMSLPDGERKRSFATSWPRYAFLDPKYTYSLSEKATVSCALDAFAHATESYLSPKSTVMSRLLSVYAAKTILPHLKDKNAMASKEGRKLLQNAACAAGMAISVTGTGAPHPLGYSLTMLDGVPHGAACAVFYREFIEYNATSPDGESLVNEFCREIGCSKDELCRLIPEASGVCLTMSEEQIRHHVELIKSAKNFVNSPYVLSDEEKLKIYRNLFAK